MDLDTLIAQFGEIEQKVERLISVYHDSQRKTIELSNRIKSLEEELRTKTEAEHRYTEEKALIRSKIDGLVTKLDELLQS